MRFCSCQGPAVDAGLTGSLTRRAVPRKEPRRPRAEDSRGRGLVQHAFLRPLGARSRRCGPGRRGRRRGVRRVEAATASAARPVRSRLTDINMPDINGLELIQFIRTNEHHRATPILLISTQSSERDRNPRPLARCRRIRREAVHFRKICDSREGAARERADVRTRRWLRGSTRHEKSSSPKRRSWSRAFPANLLALNTALRAGQEDPGLVNEAFRAVHTLKGLAGLFGAKRVSTLSHRLEDVLDSLRLGRAAAHGAVLDLLFRAVELYGDALSVERARSDDPLPAIEASSTSSRTSAARAPARPALCHGSSSIRRCSPS